MNEVEDEEALSSTVAEPEIGSESDAADEPTEELKGTEAAPIAASGDVEPLAVVPSSSIDTDGTDSTPSNTETDGTDSTPSNTETEVTGENKEVEGENQETPLGTIATITAVLLVAYLLVNFINVWTTAHNDYEQTAPVAVVLGAAQYNGVPSDAFRGRLDTAAGLYRTGQVPLIVVTGGSQENDITTEAKSGYDYLRTEYSIPDEDLLLEVQGRSTYESLAATARFLQGKGIDEVIVVTDPYHAARSELVAEEVGLTAHSVSTNARVSPSRWIAETIWVSTGRLTSYRRVDALVHGSATENSLAPPTESR